MTSPTLRRAEQSVDNGDDPAATDERLVLAAAQTLLENGEDTTGVLGTARNLGRALGRPIGVVPAWGEIALRLTDRLVLTAPAVPWNVNMRRVTATLSVAQAIAAGRLRGESAARALADAAKLPPSNDWVFALMCGLGAPALALVNGLLDPASLVVVGCAAFLGGLLRRWIGVGLGIDNGLVQLFAAALLAGAAGGAAVRMHVAFGSGLVALGPLLVLVPGPALLGGAFDLMGLRIPLGLARLTYGLLSITALSAGVLLGAGLIGGVTPDPQAPPPHLALWQDMLCAGIASAAYAVFFSMPWRMLVIPVMACMLAHGVRWVCLTDFHLANASAAGLACLLVGVTVEPISRRLHLPFAAVGFASVVSQVPGIYLFRMGAGLVQLQRLNVAASDTLLAGIVADGGAALLTLITMALGLVIPKSIYMWLGERPSASARA